MRTITSGGARIRLCGQLTAEIDGRRIDDQLRGRQGRLLFAFLVLHRHRSVRRDELIEALWPGAMPRNPEAALTTLLSRLRATLGSEVLQGKRELRLLLPDDSSVDIEESRSALASAHADIRAGCWAAACDAARLAAATSEHGLLPSEETAWLDHVRQELEEQHLEALECLARAGVELGGGDLAAAEGAARELIERAPYRETGYMALMRAHAARGNVAEALQVYDLLRVLLREELGATPATSIQELHRRLLEGGLEPEYYGGALGTEDVRGAREPDDADRALTPGAADPGEPSIRPPGARPLPLPSLLAARDREPFFGREDALSRLSVALERTQRGERRLELLAGEAGMGKTRLAARFAASAQALGATVLYGRTDEEALIAYQPFVEAVRHYVVEARDQELAARATDASPELARLVPELHRRLPALPEPARGDADTQRYRMFDAVGSLLEALGSEAPLVLVLDDLHWADRPTLALLRHLVRVTGGNPFLILGLYRPSEARASATLGDLLGQLRREQGSEELELRGLAKTDVSALVGDLAGSDASPALARNLHRGTEGNPFFIGEIVRHLRDSRELAGSPASGGLATTLRASGVPEGIRDVIVRRLSDLDQETQDLLRIASAIGTEFELSVLDRVTEPPAERLVEALEEAVRLRLLMETEGVIGRYAFAHALIRATLYDGMTATRRARLHRRIADALEELVGEDPGPKVSALAYHRFESRALGDSTRAKDLAVLAARQATAQLAYEDAVAHLERALAILGGEDEVDEHERIELLLALAEARASAGNQTGALDPFARAADLARSVGTPRQLARAALGFAGKGHGSTGVVNAPAVALLEEAASALAEEEGELNARVLSRLAVEIYWSPEVVRRRELAEKAVGIARRTGDPLGLATALNAQIWSTWGPDNPRERAELGEEAVALAEAAGDEATALECRTWRLAALAELGDLGAFDSEVAAYEPLAERLGQPPYVVYAATHRCYRALLDGRHEEAATLVADIAERGRRLEDPNTDGMVTSKKVWLGREIGGLEEVVEVAEAATSLLPAMPVWRALLSRIYADLERWQDAQREYEALAARDFADVPLDMFWMLTVGLLAEDAVLLDDGPRAAVLHGLLSPYAGRNVTATFDLSIGSASRLLGGLAAVTGELDDAVRHFEGALADHERWGAAAWAARTRHEYASVLQARGREGDSERADALREQALRAAGELGMVRLRAQIVVPLGG